MGIRGAATLLSLDRRRYGHQWTLDAETCSNTKIYIDGPALQYFLIKRGLIRRKNDYNYSLQVPLVIPCDSKDASIIADEFLYGLPLSPTAMYIQARSFISSLISSSQLDPNKKRSESVEGSRDGMEIHLVMEGLSHVSKSSTQISRMAERADTCSAAAQFMFHGSTKSTERGGGSVAFVPHLFADHAMAIAFEESVDKARKMGVAISVHYAMGEAEEEISSLLRVNNGDNGTESQNCNEKNNSVVVLTTDTDFLVYESSPGFVDLDTLEFTSVNGEIDEFAAKDNVTEPAMVTVTGWYYERDKFMRAHRLENIHMPLIAAFSGCDYGTLQMGDAGKILDKQLSSSQKVVMSSAIAGIKRRKDQLNPSSKTRFLASIRFVAFHGKPVKLKKSEVLTAGEDISPNVNKLIIEKVAFAAVGEGKGQADRCRRLMEALNIVLSVYQSSLCFQLPTGVASVDKGVTLQKNTNFRLTSPIDVDIRRIVLHASFYCRPIVETWKRRLEQKANPNDESSSDMCSCTSHNCYNSVWMYEMFINIRMRMYQILLSSSPYLSQQIFFTDTVTEHCRGIGGTSSAPSFQSFSRKSQMLTEPSGATLLFDSPLDHCLLGGIRNESKQSCLMSSLSTVPVRLRTAFLAGCIILEHANIQSQQCSLCEGGETVSDSMISLSMLCIMSSIPTKHILRHCECANNSYAKCAKVVNDHLLDSLNIVQVSYFHASMLMNSFLKEETHARCEHAILAIFSISFSSVIQKALLNAEARVHDEVILSSRSTEEAVDNTHSALLNNLYKYKAITSEAMASILSKCHSKDCSTEWNKVVCNMWKCLLSRYQD